MKGGRGGRGNLVHEKHTPRRTGIVRVCFPAHSLLVHISGEDATTLINTISRLANDTPVSCRTGCTLYSFRRLHGINHRRHDSVNQYLGRKVHAVEA